jgi:hyaluronan synthase
VDSPSRTPVAAQASQREGVAALVAVARATAQTVPFTRVAAKEEVALDLRPGDRGYRERGRRRRVRGGGAVAVAARQTTPGALSSAYEIPTVTFSRKTGRGLALTGLLLASVAAWRASRGVPWALLAAAAPTAGFRALSWGLSWLDKPVTVSPAAQARLSRLHVTVAVPCYNEDPPLLDRCLYALANQTRPPQMVWVVDDGSSEDYTALRSYWARRWPGGTEVRWSRQANQGKRRAHAVVFAGVPEADIFVTVDSDTTLALNAIEEGLKPFACRRVMSVAGIEHGYNASVNFLTRLQCSLQLFSQAVTAATWAVFGDMYTNRGPFALYRAHMVRHILPVYRDEHFCGRRIILGDDSLLALAGSAHGRAVQQLSAFGLTLWPENLSHHLRQRVRWARGRAVRNFWRLRYRPLWSYCWWYTTAGVYVFLSSCGLLGWTVLHWPADRRMVGYALLSGLCLSLLASPRVLGIRKSDETWEDRVLLVLMRPLAALWSSVVLARAVRVFGTATLLRQGWTTRQEGPEIVLSTGHGTASQPPARDLEEAIA